MHVDEVWQTIDAERASLADLFEDLSAQEWETPSLCDGWRVRDVAAHLTLAHTGVVTAVREMLRARGDMGRMIHDSAVRRAQLPVARYAPMLRAMVGSRRKVVGLTPLEPLIDVLVHGQDIAVPLGRTRTVPTRAAAAAATRVWSMGQPWHAGKTLRGLRLTATDTTWSVGEGREVTGPMASLLLVLTHRPAGLPLLKGDGVGELRDRIAAPAPNGSPAPA